MAFGEFFQPLQWCYVVKAGAAGHKVNTSVKQIAKEHGAHVNL